MPLSPKVSNKLKNSKQAAVSLDSLLGLLSSAYGTEELDSSTVFEKHLVNWGNLSVESFKTLSKKEEQEGEKQKRLKQKESEKINVATSTTNLKLNEKTESDVDVTLLSVKSLENMKQNTICKSDSTLNILNENSSPVNLSESNECNEKDLNLACDDVELQDIQKPPICGFYVDSLNKEMIFDIKFSKKLNKNKVNPLFEISEAEISVNVIDTIKLAKSSIMLTKSQLVSNAQYFADVDKEFGLENLDVTIQCNVGIFLWVVQWVKADLVMCKPTLNFSNIKLVLSMAYHLGISILLDECLDFFHKNYEKILEKDIDFVDILNDDLILRLIKLYSNGEINHINGNFERFKSKMFCTLIKLLVDPNPCVSLGHYSTLATIFQCSNCEKFLNYEMSDLVPCRSDCNEIDLNGKLIYHHQRSSSWNLSRYVEMVFDDLKSWMAVYWRLWGMCHFLACTECNTVYPLSQSDWCPYHMSQVEYFPLNQSLAYPIGMYSCCGERSFGFSVLKPYGGCHYKSHTPDLSSTDSQNIYKILEANKNLITCLAPENVITKKFVRLIKKESYSEILPSEIPSQTFWWQGIKLAPKEKKDYSIIPIKVLDHLKNRHHPNKGDLKCRPLDYKQQVHFGTMPSIASFPEETSEHENETSRGFGKKNKPKLVVSKARPSNFAFSLRSKMKKRKSSLFGYHQPGIAESLWVSGESNKDNQDNQRDFEEEAMRKLVRVLSPALTGGGGCFSPEPPAGTYLRLETEWWQEHCKPTDNKSGGKSGTVVNRTFPLSWYRRLTI